jgi:hypothetical protein
VRTRDENQEAMRPGARQREEPTPPSPLTSHLGSRGDPTRCCVPEGTRVSAESLVGRQGEQAQLASKRWTLGLKVPSRRLSTHVHGRPPTSTGDHPLTVPRFQGRPPTSTDVPRLGCQLAVSKTASAGDRPRWTSQSAGASGSGKGLPAAGRRMRLPSPSARVVGRTARTRERAAENSTFKNVPGHW